MWDPNKYYPPLGQGGPESNDDKVVLYTPQISKTVVLSLSDAVQDTGLGKNFTFDGRYNRPNLCPIISANQYTGMKRK